MNRELLKKDLADYKAAGGKWVDLAKASGVRDPTISRAASGKNKTDYETWLKLHEAAPEFIRHPLTGQKGDQVQPTQTPPPSIVKLRVYELTAGEPHFTDGGKVVGREKYTQAFPVEDVSELAFVVILPDDSMEPEFKKNSRAVVDPADKQLNGKLCLAAFPDGQRIVRKYSETKGIVLLEPSNSNYKTIILKPSEQKSVKIFKIVFVGISTR